MRKYDALFLSVAVSILCFQNVSSAHAETTALPPGIFHMADGVYYHPKSGAKSTDLATILAAYDAFVQASNATSTATSTPAQTAPAIPSLAAVERAHTLLMQSPALDITPVDAIPDWRTVRLAIWNPTSDALRIVEGEKNEKQFKQTTGDGTVTVLRANGVNSSYRVGSGDGAEIVVAVSYPIYRERPDGRFDVERALYTPYHATFNNEQVTAAGEAWLAKNIADAEAELRAAAVPSRAFPDRLLADVIDPAFVASILTIEHVDLSAAQNDVRAQIGAFYAILATNKERSYAYSRSGAGALGIAQFIPKTYAWLAAQPGLALNPDFEQGMTNPKNAVKAQIAYLDYLLSVLPREARDAYVLPDHRFLVQEYIAAAYNGGPARVKKAMVVWDENLDAAERIHVRTRSRLKMETVEYVLKLRLVRPVLTERFTALEKA